MKNEIKIRKKFIGFRNDAVDFKRKILRNQWKSVDLNFSEVVFITGAFADELLKIKGELSTGGIRISFSHLGPDVKKMISAVEKRKLRWTKLKN